VFKSQTEEDEELDEKLKVLYEEIRDFMNVKIKEEFDNKPPEEPVVIKETEETQ
jgi:hypothetical protein